MADQGDDPKLSQRGERRDEESAPARVRDVAVTELLPASFALDRLYRTIYNKRNLSGDRICI